MNRLVTTLLLSIAILSACTKPVKQKVILVIFAHPDDEHAIGPMLVKYGKTNKIHLLIATDGKLGVRPGYPTGDSLVLLRQKESQCSCKIMGIEPPVFLGFPDGFDTRDGVGNYLAQSVRLKEAITKNIKELKPDLIITFGPDGDTGHSDHRMISNMTTEVLLKEGWAEKIPLYYLGWTKKDDEKFKMIGGLNTVDKKYLNIAIRYSQEEEDKAMEALWCDKSQLSEKEMQEWKDVEKKDVSNTFYFWELRISKELKTDF